mmetsp:Transcript_8223/g.19360  ORF Transcript_8223/g.19360 Transcript_8223/m.19360 type:complete len:206 (+) Transcript_8223:1161-1778(+)
MSTQTHPNQSVKYSLLIPMVMVFKSTTKHMMLSSTQRCCKLALRARSNPILVREACSSGVEMKEFLALRITRVTVVLLTPESDLDGPWLCNHAQGAPCVKECFKWWYEPPADCRKVDEESSPGDSCRLRRLGCSDSLCPRCPGDPSLSCWPLRTLQSGSSKVTCAAALLRRAESSSQRCLVFCRCSALHAASSRSCSATRSANNL